MLRRIACAVFIQENHLQHFINEIGHHESSSTNLSFQSKNIRHKIRIKRLTHRADQTVILLKYVPSSSRLSATPIDDAGNEVLPMDSTGVPT